MALSVVVIVVMCYLLANRPPPPGFAVPATASSSPTEEPTAPADTRPAEESTAPEEVRVLVIGEGVTDAPEPGAASWPQLVAEDISSAGGPPLALTVAASRSAGYVQAPPGGATFSRLAQDAGGDFDVVIFFGSRVDIAAAVEVRAAAEAAFAAVRSASPEADLLVVGPAWPAGDPPTYIETNRDALSAAAAGVGAPFVDPLVERWLTAPGMVGPNGVGLTPAGQRFLADRIRPLVEQALRAEQ